MFQCLLNFIHQNGHSNVLPDYEYIASDGTVLKLGLWVVKQRADHSRGNLTEQREQLLSKLVTEGISD